MEWACMHIHELELQVCNHIAYERNEIMRKVFVIYL